MAPLPRIAVTMGDPAGVGPEVCLHLLADAAIARQCVPIVFGDAAILRRVSEAARLRLSVPVISSSQWENRWTAVDRPSILDLQAIATSELQPGQVSAKTGRAGFTYVDRAIDAALAGKVAAVS